MFLAVQYSLQFDCPPASGTSPPAYVTNVTVPAGSTALDVMQAAVSIDNGFKFSATNFGSALGFSIDEISGTASSNMCYWKLFVKTPANFQTSPAAIGVSHFVICSEGYEIIYVYTAQISSGGQVYSGLDTYIMICALILFTEWCCMSY